MPGGIRLEDNALSLFSKDKKTKQEEQVKLTGPQKIVEYLRDIIAVFVIFLIVYMLLFRVVVVDGDSMNNTLYDGDRLILLSSSVYRNPEPGDIVVCSMQDFDGGRCIVKRVIAVEGQKVRIINNMVLVDNVPLDEPYAVGDTLAPTEQEVTVPEGCVFVMGDNREYSLDSRNLGFIDKREIVGKVIFLLVPGPETGRGESDSGRIGTVD